MRCCRGLALASMVLGAGLCWVSLAAAPQAGPQVPAAKLPQFDSGVLPILKANCVQCHGDKVRMKELDLSSLPALLNGSESGPVVVSGKPDESRLYKLVNEGTMPMGKPRLSDQNVATIRSWIESLGLPSASRDKAAETEELTQHDAIPILLARCSVCHGVRRQEGGLDLRTRASLLKGGKSGPAIVPGKPEQSLLIQKIRSGEMPPKEKMLEVSVRPIAESETEKLAQWIAQGALEGDVQPDVTGLRPDPLVSDQDRQFWAFQPPRAVQPPKVRHTNRVRSPIDAFILQKLEEKGLMLSPEADRLTLIRRASFDLTGLPPKPEEVQAFLSDPDPKAFEKLVEKLLASPGYGERWGQYWLDAAGYADSEGKQNKDLVRPVAFRYRDYVIRSFNADKPYDRFLLEQIAGDELENYEDAPVITEQMMDNLIATGFLRMAADATDQRDMNFLDDRHEVIADEIDIFSSTVLGLTLKCARCHSHKYEPFPQRDYFRLVDIFKGAFDEHEWLAPSPDKQNPGRHLPYVTPGATPMQVLQQEREREERNREIQQQVETLLSLLKQSEEQVFKRILEQRVKEIPEELREDVRKLLDTPPDKRDGAQKYLFAKFQTRLTVNAPELKTLDAEYRRLAEETERKIKLLQASRPPEPLIRALWDRGSPSPTYMLQRGNSTSFGRLVSPGIPSVLTDGKTPFEARPPLSSARATGRRLALARWLVRPDNPLTARVMMNRIWHHHFGAGIVRSVASFGRSGEHPTHPELLDWLAVELVRSGWSVKAMHRLMMTSSAYRQSSRLSPSQQKLDPKNELLSRMPLRRMEAEALHDTLLLVSGRLDETRYGFPAPVMVREDGLVTPIGSEKGWRRSIYVLKRRKDTPTILATFDFPQMNPNCVERTESTVASQALFLRNDSLIRELAGHFAARIEREAGQDPIRQVERMYWLALSRPPTEEEKKLNLETLSRFQQLRSKPEDSSATMSTESGLARLCHTLFNTAAFLYID
ncbi:MAG: PSD1 and planctomycete cytochrome C domain-containing protein [Acidobacteria bacterium]|nr:PSD1 and planctomycete cytochrome C domain-containing protein [Acidobacteriota bacterium]